MAEYRVNGKKLIITPVSFRDALELKNAVLNSVKTQKISFDMSAVEKEGGNTFDTLVSAILSIASSPEVDRLLMQCAEKSLIGEMNEKPDADYFEKPQNRVDYYPVMYNVLVENLGPFFKGGYSMFTALAGTMVGNAPVPKSMQASGN